MSAQPYVHGYSPTEVQRLHDQANTLETLLHHDSLFAPNTRVLEAGCGVGAQTTVLARQNPEAHITSIDVEESSLAHARALVEREALVNVEVRRADLYELPFPPDHFDHIFVCFVLEHLPDPAGALSALMRVLRVGGTITVIEGDHGSALFHPESAAAHQAVQCLCTLQQRAGGNALMGRALYPLLASVGLEDVRVSPRFVYCDATRPELMEGFVEKTFTAMVAGVRERVLEAELLSPEQFDQGVEDLARTAKDDGAFCYTFFKAWGTKGET